MKLKSLAVLALTGLCASSLAFAGTNNNNMKNKMLADDSNPSQPAQAAPAPSPDSSGSTDTSNPSNPSMPSSDDTSGSDTGTGDDDY